MKKMSAIALDRFSAETGQQILFVRRGTVSRLLTYIYPDGYNTTKNNTLNWHAYRLPYGFILHGEDNLPKSAVEIADWQQYEFAARMILDNPNFSFDAKLRKYHQLLRDLFAEQAHIQLTKKA